MMWVGVLSLCGCETISGLFPRIYPTILLIVSLQNLYALFELNHCIFSPCPHFFAWLSCQCIFGNYVNHFSLVKLLSFSFNIFVFGIIFGSSPFSFLVSPKIVMFATFESPFSLSPQLAQVFK